ncbi:hypothetical protein SAMN05444362_11110 [Dysgonomonas macrotermitis]|uniref:Lipoprotein n=1 Tax=Dysgonomonas macrotermitis TaxID=1346286 RepID=A0A1M5F0A7_9BACT|nr:hypothetical protein [Dysgonomonas macrotermitis]SHF84866.1 hypothetical protein SAMN05444362_11110 [Dysgonomonas macrotermitis]
MILKNKYLFISFLSVVLLLTACTGNNPLSKVNVDKPRISYGGVSFNFPEQWKLETENIDNGDISYIDIADDEDLYMKIWIMNFVDIPEKKLENYLLDWGPEYKVESEAVASARFGEYDAKMRKYSVSLNDLAVYGNAYSFCYGGKTFLITKHSESRVKLQHSFSLIESTFHIE